MTPSMTPSRLIVAVAGLAISASLAAPAQTASGSAGAQVNRQSSVQPGAQPSSQSIAVTDRYLTSVQTELTSKIDTRNAAVGQAVTARTTQTAKLADGTTFPRGTKLAGRITQVQAQDKASGRTGSLLAITFDHAELKSGQTLQLRSVIQTVAPPAPMSASADTQSMAPIEPMGGGVSSAGSPRGGLGTGVGGGGVRPINPTAGPIGQTPGSLGRTAGSIDQSTDSIGQTTGSIGDGVGTTAGRATANTAGGLGSATRATGRPVVSAGESVSNTARATGMPGVMLNTTDTAYTSGTLIAPGKNITLESGTQITLGVIAR
jgi:hypothetical protein